MFQLLLNICSNSCLTIGNQGLLLLWWFLLFVFLLGSFRHRVEEESSSIFLSYYADEAKWTLSLLLLRIERWLARIWKESAKCKIVQLSLWIIFHEECDFQVSWARPHTQLFLLVLRLGQDKDVRVAPFYLACLNWQDSSRQTKRTSSRDSRCSNAEKFYKVLSRAKSFSVFVVCSFDR